MLSSDIYFKHSGGTTNNIPEFDLGGPESQFDVSFSPTLNNLFDDVTPHESEEGLIDYRCIYILNNHSTDSLSVTKVYIDSQVSGGSSIRIGSVLEDEVQEIRVSGSVVDDGYMILTVPDWTSPFTIYPANGAAEFQEMIRTQIGMQDVTVSGDMTDGFEITFTGEDCGNHSMPMISLVQNSLGPSGIVNISRITTGSPIGIDAELIPYDTLQPVDVDFDLYLIGSPITIGTVRAGESFFVWSQRDTQPETSGKLLDNFVLGISGESP